MNHHRQQSRLSAEAIPRNRTSHDELYRLLIESVSDYAIFALDRTGHILTWNPGAERFKGYRADEIIGKHFSIFYPPERAAEGFPDFELREAARLGRFEDEGWRVRKDGSRFWANVVITALRDASGELIGFAKVTRDLSERRAAEEELRQSEERFRLLVQGVRDYAIFLLDPGGYVTTWNAGAQGIKQYTADEIIGRHFSVFYTPEDLADGKPARELEIATRTGTYEEEGWRLRKDGTRFWANVLITALRKPDGTLAGFAKVTRDLTERRAAAERALDGARRVAAEEAARALADEHRATAIVMQTLTAKVAAARTVDEINAIIFGDALRIFGAATAALGLVDRERNEIRLAGTTGFEPLPAWTECVNLDEQTPMSVAARTGMPVVARTRAERDERFPRLAALLAPFNASVAYPLHAREGIVGALALHWGEEHALSEHVLRGVGSFAQQVAQALERTTLYEAERVARRRADEANQAKSAFLAAMSHELRTPLNAIGGYADLMDLGVRGPTTPEQHEALQRIKRSQEHLLGIINDILSYSRIEAGHTRYELARFNLAPVLDSVGGMIVPQANQKGIELVVEPCSPQLAVYADRPKVDQILLNLLSNAVKFTKTGGVTVSCNTADERHVDIVVRDTGEGIPATHLESIFDPFVQVGRSLTNNREGTGLGLAISRDLARDMKGDITVASEPGKGSTFTLRLPTTAESK